MKIVLTSLLYGSALNLVLAGSLLAFELDQTAHPVGSTIINNTLVDDGNLNFRAANLAADSTIVDAGGNLAISVTSGATAASYGYLRSNSNIDLSSSSINMSFDFSVSSLSSSPLTFGIYNAAFLGASGANVSNAATSTFVDLAIFGGSSNTLRLRRTNSAGTGYESFNGGTSLWQGGGNQTISTFALDTIYRVDFDYSSESDVFGIVVTNVDTTTQIVSTSFNIADTGASGFARLGAGDIFNNGVFGNDYLLISDTAVIPEPTSSGLLGAGLAFVLGSVFHRRRLRRSGP